MADKNNHWFEHLIDGETIDSISTLYERINHFFANLTKEFIPLSQEEVFNYSVKLVILMLQMTSWFQLAKLINLFIL